MGIRVSKDLESQILAAPGLIEHGRPVQPVALPPAPECFEKEFLARVIAYAESRGWLVYHTHDSRKSKAGFPDLTMAREPRCTFCGGYDSRGLIPNCSGCGRRLGPGRVIFAELKTETGKESKAQAEWRKRLEAVGGNVEAYIFRPRDWDKIQEVLL